MRKYLLALVILIQSCNPEPELEITGEWKFLNNRHDAIIKPFKSFCPTSYPDYFQCYENVYFENNLIEQPLLIGKKEFKITDKYISYEIIKNKIRFSKDTMSFEYDWQLAGNRLCFDQGKFCLERVDRTPIQIDSTILKFQVTQEESPSYTVWLNYKYLQDTTTVEVSYQDSFKPYERVPVLIDVGEVEYIVKLLGRIPEKYLNRIYNNSLSDCIGISIDYYTASGNWKGIETCGVGFENPFEIRSLVSNVLWIMDKHVREE